jgi:hypothetical protein
MCFPDGCLEILVFLSEREELQGIVNGFEWRIGSDAN